MRVTALLISMAGVAVGMTLAAPPVASGAPGVYGGSTRAGEAIVFKSDRTGRRVRSAVMAVEASCDDGREYSVSAMVTAARHTPGFDPGPRDLTMRRNRAGRFAGTVVMAESLGADGEQVGLVAAEVSGRLRRASASGTLSATVTVIERATGAEVATCTGRVRWTAARAAGRVYGGATSQGEPFVARLNRRGGRVDNVYVTAHSQECVPDGFLRLPGRFGNFQVDRRGRWGATWDEDVALDAGASASFSYALHGTLRRTTARGTFSIGLERRDAAGAVDLTCQTGTITWKAATG